MFNYIKIEFPESPNIQPAFVYSATLHQNRYEHEIATVEFKDWGVSYEAILPNSPVSMTIYGPNRKREFHGYVHHIKPERTPGKDFVEAVLIGASFPLKATSQKVYKNVTADQVVREIAKKHGFACYAVPHPRVYPQLAQAGLTDWQLMVKLAKQSGYTLRTQNTEIYFQPVLDDYTRYRSEAPRFKMGVTSSIDGTSIYSFNPSIGETIEYDDAKKAAIAVSGLDPLSSEMVSYTTQKPNKKTRSKQRKEIFDNYSTSVVAPDIKIAKFEADAAESLNAFPYRAKLEVIGDPSLRPDMPIYLEGLGETYSGYWTILSTEHTIVEEELNRHRYTTVLEVGTDSLGQAVDWTDNKRILSPDYMPTRTIVPSVKQTKVVPKSQLVNTTIKVTPQTESLFGTVKNRNRVNTSRVVEAPIWKSTTPNLNPIIAESRRSAVVTERVAKATA